MDYRKIILDFYYEKRKEWRTAISVHRKTKTEVAFDEVIDAQQAMITAKELLNKIDVSHTELENYLTGRDAE